MRYLRLCLRLYLYQGISRNGLVQFGGLAGPHIGRVSKQAADPGKS